MRKLREILAEEDTVLFIGSGISSWATLPTWAQLIEELAQFLESAGVNAELIRAEVSKGDLLQAASFGFDKLTKHQIGDFIRAACRYGVAKPHDIHRRIVSLGPRCFITTNYDNLLEESLRIWQPNRFYRPPVTNRHLTEMGEIIHARAIDFIFKPHGDAADSDSIVLTREQYRQLLPDGERHAALDSLQMLLASRPVVYLGFGLRDPDFGYLRDLLANTYKGGTRDHYALMPDVSDDERDYWRRNYGIHLISYKTDPNASGAMRHAALLDLLDTLRGTRDDASKRVYFDPEAPESVLALARHAASLTRTQRLEREFKIRVNSEGTARHKSHEDFAMHDRFDYTLVTDFLDSGPPRALLIGLPGAGKTYSLRQAASRAADRLHEQCLQNSFDPQAIVVPIFADLKLYRGNLSALVGEMLPSSLPLTELVKCLKVKIFLDSFNEMPREYLETGDYESDFASFIDQIGESSIVIGSRTSDGLTKLSFPAYYLELIDLEAVKTELERLNIKIEGRFKHEVLSVLQRPFYFRYVAEERIRLTTDAHPRDFHRIWFENLENSFRSRFASKFDLEHALSIVAYDALNRGEEAFALSDLISVLTDQARSLDLALDAREIANWLAASSVLIPHSRGRVAFVHQSVTEYLAATELAQRYQASPRILKEKLSLTRWDQALFLTLSVLSADRADAFLKDVIKADLLLALSAAKYLEIGRDEAVTVLLSEIQALCDAGEQMDTKIAWRLESDLPISVVHEDQLRKLVSQGNTLGGCAAARLIELKGAELKQELLQLIVAHHGDYNFCTHIGRSLRPFAQVTDVKEIARWADQLEFENQPHDATLESEGSDDNEDINFGFTSGVAAFLNGLELSIIWREFVPHSVAQPISSNRARILCDILRDHADSKTALIFARELLTRGVADAAITIYFISEFAELSENLSWDSFTSKDVDVLKSLAVRSSENWALPALRNLCAARPDLAKQLKGDATYKNGLERALLMYSVSPSDLAPVFEALSEVVDMSETDRRLQPIEGLEHVELDWAGREELFLKVMKTRDSRFAEPLFGGSIPPTILGLGNLDIGEIYWWLDWILDLHKNADNQWFAEQLGSLLGNHLTAEKESEFVAEFNRADSQYRRSLQQYILPYFKRLTTDAFDENTISFLLADLSRSSTTFRWHLLGITATEQFTSRYLLPLLLEAKPPLLNNLREVLREAGSRHGRRYVFEGP